MPKKLLAVFAHPDDEAFGPGGTLALYAKQGVEIHLLCATRGESGKRHASITHAAGTAIHSIREKELMASIQVLGIKRVEFLDYFDGHLCNAVYHEIAGKIQQKIELFAPQVVMTFDRLGVSGHIDHMALSMMTTYAFKKSSIAKKLYYYCLTKTVREADAGVDDYFIYFPEGYAEDDVTTWIDYTSVWEVKKNAMQQHKSQQSDVDDILRWISPLPKTDHFILHTHRDVDAQLPEIDLFAGVSH